MKIFVLHKWRQPHIRYVLQELIKNNPSNDIVFLTDDKNLSKEYFWFNIIYENISDYFQSAEDFSKIYIHKSKNSLDFELICIQRRLVINEYMEKHNIDSCWHIDSDVLVFCDLEKYADTYLKNDDFCYVWSCWHVFYWNKKWLSEFKNFIFDVYNNRLDTLDWFYKKEWYPIYPRNNWFIAHEKSWSVSDMTLFYLFIKENIEWIKYKDIWMINNDENSVFDNNIKHWEWFKHNKYMKSLRLVNNKYFWKLEWKVKMRDISFNCLHFQWGTKGLIKYYQQRNLWIKYSFQFIQTFIIHPAIVRISKKLWVDSFLARVYDKIRHIIYKESHPFR